MEEADISVLAVAGLAGSGTATGVEGVEGPAVEEADVPVLVLAEFEGSGTATGVSEEADDPVLAVAELAGSGTATGVEDEPGLLLGPEKVESCLECLESEARFDSLLASPLVLVEVEGFLRILRRLTGGPEVVLGLTGSSDVFRSDDCVLIGTSGAGRFIEAIDRGASRCSSRSGDCVLVGTGVIG